jgi:hypothetical protein
MVSWTPQLYAVSMNVRQDPRPRIRTVISAKRSNRSRRASMAPGQGYHFSTAHRNADLGKRHDARQSVRHGRAGVSGPAASRADHVYP